MAISYHGVPLDHPQFVDIIYSLLQAAIPTVIVEGPFGPVVVTWQRVANA
jgi:hypothetical protein